MGPPGLSAPSPNRMWHQVANDSCRFHNGKAFVSAQAEFGDLDVPYWVSRYHLALGQRGVSWPVQESDNMVFSACISGAERTLFRTHNGFSIISDNEVIRR